MNSCYRNKHLYAYILLCILLWYTYIHICGIWPANDMCRIKHIWSENSKSEKKLSHTHIYTRHTEENYFQSHWILGKMCVNTARRRQKSQPYGGEAHAQGNTIYTTYIVGSCKTRSILPYNTIYIYEYWNKYKDFHHRSAASSTLFCTWRESSAAETQDDTNGKNFYKIKIHFLGLLHAIVGVQVPRVRHIIVTYCSSWLYLVIPTMSLGSWCI